MNYYISDTHFGHYNIIKHCHRPFKTAEEMDNAMIKNWNDTVSQNDTVYILGDIAFSKTDPMEYLKQLNGKKIVVVGNHDYDISKNRKKYIESKTLYGIYDYLEIKDFVNNQPYKIVMSHYPMVEWNGFFRGSIHLYGHIHNNEQNNAYRVMSMIENAFNVGADVLGFRPRTLAEIVRK